MHGAGVERLSVSFLEPEKAANKFDKVSERKRARESTVRVATWRTGEAYAESPHHREKN